jgi:L-2-hydroxyglutarate oxidase
MSESIVIVGGGIVGLAAAYRLGQRFPDARITVLEKESTVCAHQSGHNSGVLHAGLYYKPGSAKARLAVRGIRQMVEFCQRHSIPHDVCGKVVVATSEDQVPRLRGLYERGQQNGLSGLRLHARGASRD